jgi:outer membrane protein
LKRVAIFEFSPGIVFFLGFLALLNVALCRAGEIPSTQMHLSLEECIDIALGHNAQIVQSRFGREVADVQVENARNAFLPTLNTSYGFSRQRTGPREGAFVDPGTGLLVTSLGESSTSGSQSVGASMGMSLYDPSNWANLSASKHGRKAAEMDQVTIRQQVIFQVKQGYFNLLQALELMQVQQDQIHVSEEDLRRAETLYQIHSVPLADVLTTRATLESARAQLIQQENNVEAARYQLSFTMGLDMDKRVFPDAEEFVLQPFPLSFAEVLAQVMESHPTLLAQKYSMLQARDELKSTQYGVRHPTVSMGAGYSWRLTKDEHFQGAEDLFLKNYSYSLNLTLSLPLFNRFSTENSVRIQKLNYLQSLEGLDLAKRQVALDIRQAFLNIEQYRRSITANEAALRAAEESFAMAQERYGLGAGTLLERLQAQNALFQARNNRVQAIYNYHIQLAQLELAMGGPLGEGP